MSSKKTYIMKKYLFILLILLTGCSINKRCSRLYKICPKNNNQNIKDSIVIETKIVNTIDTLFIKLPSDTVLIEKLIKTEIPLKLIKLNLDTFKDVNGIIGVSAWINNNSLGAMGWVADSGIFYQYYNEAKEKTIWRKRFKEELQKNSIVKKENTSFAIFTEWWFWFSLIVLIILMLWKYIKTKFIYFK